MNLNLSEDFVKNISNARSNNYDTLIGPMKKKFQRRF